MELKLPQLVKFNGSHNFLKIFKLTTCNQLSYTTIINQQFKLSLIKSFMRESNALK